MGDKVMERLSNRKWREMLGRYIFGTKETEYPATSAAAHFYGITTGPRTLPVREGEVPFTIRRQFPTEAAGFSFLK